MSTSAEFILFKGDHSLSEEEFEHTKLGINPILQVTVNAIRARHPLMLQVNYLTQEFAEFDTNVSQLKQNKIEFDETITSKKNHLYVNFINLEAIANELVHDYDTQCQQLTIKSAEFTDLLKSKLKTCLKTNLHDCPDAVINPLFTTKNIPEILDFFADETEFSTLAKEKNFRRIDPANVINLLAKAVAIKAVSPMLSGKEREHQIKDNLKKIKTCIKIAQTELNDFINNHNCEVADNQKQLLQEIKDSRANLAKLLSKDTLRKLSYQKHNDYINNKAKEPAAERPEVSMDQAINASRIMHRNN